MVLSVRNLCKRFTEAGQPAVCGMCFDLAAGEILAIVGPSGCGKTTTLRLIAGFERPDNGMVRLGDRVLLSADERVRAEARGIGFVFQDFALFPHLTVEKNIAFGLRRMNRAARKARVRELVRMLSLGGLTERYPHELSGGEQQRVALARSLAPAPNVILLDEPFSNLDAALRASTRMEIRRVLKASGTSVILVTHDQEEAMTFADRVGVMNNGCLEQIGTPESVYNEPATPFVAQFLGFTNLLEARATGRTAETELGAVPIHREVTGAVTLSLRPEQLRLSYPATGLGRGTVISREFKGHDQYYRVLYRDREFYVMTDHRTAFNEGDSVEVSATEPAVVVSERASV